MQYSVKLTYLHTNAYLVADLNNSVNGGVPRTSDVLLAHYQVWPVASCQLDRMGGGGSITQAGLVPRPKINVRIKIKGQVCPKRQRCQGCLDFLNWVTVEQV
uniref:Uncharacterized protein n=1 Tax=Oryza brachyantha TaxID=4533 RepID=J3NAI7_ORYBR